MSVVILSGPVGAGKTTVARELVKISPGPVACIEGDMFWSFIARGDQGTGVMKNFKMIMRSMVASAIPFSTSGYEVIIDFSMPPWFLETAVKIGKMREIPLSYVALRPSENICAARAAARSEGRITDYGPFKKLYASFDELPQHIMEDGLSDAATVARKIRMGLDAGVFTVQLSS